MPMILENISFSDYLPLTKFQSSLVYPGQAGSIPVQTMETGLVPAQNNPTKWGFSMEAGSNTQ